MTRAEAIALRSDGAVRQQFVSTLELALQNVDDILKSALADNDIEAYWNTINLAVTETAMEIMPQLQRVQRNWNDTRTAEAEVQFLQARRICAEESSTVRLAEPVPKAFVIWRYWTVVQQTWKHLLATRKLARSEWRQTIKAQLTEAARKHDHREMWRLQYCLTTTGHRRKKKQWAHSMQGTSPTTAEWVRQLALPGSKGGQSMEVAWAGMQDGMDCWWDLGQDALLPLNSRVRESERESRPPLPTHKAELTRTLALADWVATINEMLTAKRGRAVPAWSAPRMAWKCALIPHDEIECSPRARRALLEMCILIRQCGAQPLRHCTSATCCIDKRNCKRDAADGGD